MKKNGVIKKCLLCKKEFYAPKWLIESGRGKFCSHKCYSKNKKGKYKNSVLKKCEICGKEMRVYQYSLNRNKGKYCSKECTNKGIAKTLTGMKQSEETKEKHRKFRGETGRNWKGGISKDLAHYSRGRRNLKLNAKGEHTLGEWELLKKQYGYNCPCCKKSEPEIKLTEDHIIPLSRGGSDYIENIQPLCKRCNSKKHTQVIKFLN